MKMNRFGLVACAASIVCLGANAALAGEITGNGKWIAGDPDAPLHGRSECAYSGQQDDPIADAGFFRGDRVQSWGQVIRAIRNSLPAFLHPGIACNPVRSQGE